MEYKVEYKINDDGNCLACSCLAIDPIIGNSFCIPFKTWLWPGRGSKQCQECKDFLAKEKAKIYCLDCVYNGDYLKGGCDLGEEMKDNCEFKVKE
jgi:hypothetical protein